MSQARRTLHLCEALLFSPSLVSRADRISYRGRISSVGRAFDCRAGGRGFDTRGRTITQGLKMTEK